MTMLGTKKISQSRYDLAFEVFFIYIYIYMNTEYTVNIFNFIRGCTSKNWKYISL